MKRTYRIVMGDNKFVFGNCVTTAIGQCFKIEDTEPILKFMRLFERNPEEGITNRKCLRIIPLIAGLHNKKAEYQFNRKRLSLPKFFNSHLKGVYLFSIDNKFASEGHIGYMKNGVIYDDYLMGESENSLERGFSLTGWWEITNIKEQKKNTVQTAHVNGVYFPVSYLTSFYESMEYQ